MSLDASMAQIRGAVTESAILPLGSPYVKQNTPLVNALLLYGPHGTGKTLLSRAIAAETVRLLTPTFLILIRRRAASLTLCLGVSRVFRARRGSTCRRAWWSASWAPRARSPSSCTWSSRSPQVRHAWMRHGLPFLVWFTVMSWPNHPLLRL